MGIVNAVDICKYPQHFNRLLLIAMNKYVLFLIFIFSCIGCGETNEQDANTIEGNTDTSQITIAPVTNLKAKITQNPNELYLTWTNPITVTNMLGVEIYYKQKGSNDEKRVNTIQKGEGYVLRLTSDCFCRNVRTSWVNRTGCFRSVSFSLSVGGAASGRGAVYISS